MTYNVIETQDLGSYWMVILKSRKLTRHHRYDNPEGGRPLDDQTEGYYLAKMMVRQRWVEGGNVERSNTKEEAERIATFLVNGGDWGIYGVTADFVPTGETKTVGVWPWTGEELAESMHAWKHAD